MKIEIRNDGTGLITGYVNVVGRESRVLRDVSGSFVEVIAPKTFQRALEKNESVGLMFNHKRNLAPISFELAEDNIGLHCRAEINDTEVLDKAKAGELTGWSFGFYADSDNWDTRADGMRLRTVTELDLVEVSILDCTPAYIATSIECRDGEEHLKELRHSVDNVEVAINEQIEERAVNEPKPNLNMLEQQKRKFNFIINFKK